LSLDLPEADVASSTRRITVALTKIAFIVNPHAAAGSAGKSWPQIAALARDRLGAFQVFFTAGPGDATRLTREALSQGAETIVCVGGDGTLNEVVNGLMGEDGPIRPEVTVGFIPRSTGCDLIKTVSIHRKLDRAMDIIKGGHTRILDLGRIRYQGPRNNHSYRYFHNIASFGLGGEVDERVNRTTKALGGFLSFIGATLVSLLKYDKKRIHLKVDDAFDGEVNAWNIAVANGQYHGGGMLVAPGAQVDDGLFHVTVIGDLTLPQVFLNLPKLYNGKIYGVAKVRSFVGKRVEASSDQKVLLDVDGEQIGTLPVVIEIVPRAVSLITAA
jgi:YegS/Rv2252/BmrU family lipid kinase